MIKHAEFHTSVKEHLSFVIMDHHNVVGEINSYLDLEPHLKILPLVCCTVTRWSNIKQRITKKVLSLLILG